MPRQPRLDAPGTLLHVMGRGIERAHVFQDDTDATNRLATSEEFPEFRPLLNAL